MSSQRSEFRTMTMLAAAFGLLLAACVAWLAGCVSDASPTGSGDGGAITSASAA